MSQKDLAVLSGLDKTTVERTLNGKTDPRRSTLRRMEAALIAYEREQLARLKVLLGEAKAADAAAAEAAE
ncbi:helix-turn-helix transcriptional regulator [Ancylobacter sp. WKF20]|uniref:helix-turn-helix domain-containing protein n=1 Tax=Ancylobacter sp. WKF20 TaxID=3039801 RepID=UPI0024343E5E|nr:helix-turn-helix transcriptional regulator [Ancylobacter sp. WKF20]WGD31304.1 helix-turn-helix transcriptional regulator [Ancylobacter sp. WKF20]